MGVFAPPSPFFKNVECVGETEILVEQQPPQGILVCVHAGRREAVGDAPLLLLSMCRTGHVTGTCLLMIIVKLIPQSVSKCRFVPSLSGPGSAMRLYYCSACAAQERPCHMPPDYRESLLNL